ncbi:MAG: type II 3-dehydroquinate dehydratase [Lentisphaeria bacterium]|nr:type II 3-dehydroquinate dehydratase [Lentisphaeria bacterium]
MKNRILVINGPNLQLLGKREPEIYGNETLDDIAAKMQSKANEYGIKLEFFQSCSEGAIAERIGAEVMQNELDGIIINPGAYSHTSIAILDAIKALKIPVIEVHLSNIHAREEFRHQSMTGRGAAGVICGFGSYSYMLALDGMINKIGK